jgi:hypothetical protein
MVNTTIKETIKKSLENLAAIDQNTIANITYNLQPWNGLDYQDLRFGYNEVYELITFCVDKNLLDDLPYNIISQINLFLVNMHNLFLQLINAHIQPLNIQSIFNTLLNHVDNFRAFLRNNGIYVYVKLSPNIPEMQNSIQTQLSTITDTQGRINQLENDAKERIGNLENEIKRLISPAIAGSLSESFGNRKKFIYKMRIFFLILTAITLILGGLYTIHIVNQIISKFSLENIDKLTIAYIFLRIFTLLPVFMISGFSYRQYSRERTVEENYAHKETIATIIKTYGELITDQKVKDELLQNASKVIVSSPEKYKFEKQGKNADNFDVQTLINNLINLINQKGT